MKKIGFIGAGNMATAIIKGLMAQNDSKADFINVFDVSEEKCAAMMEEVLLHCGLYVQQVLTRQPVRKYS
mgnify:CR=1 FL=1